MHPIPDHLHGQPFTRADAHAAGITDAMLRGSRFVAVHHGVYRTSATPDSFSLLLQAARLVLPPGCAVSHVSWLRMHGFDVGPERPLHFATNHAHQHGRDNIVLHRYRHPVLMELKDGQLVTRAERVFVDVATQLDDKRLLRVGDWLVGSGLMTLDGLRTFCEESHLDGVRRARRVVRLVAERVASPMESDVRWWLHRGGLPEPEVNVDILDDHGRWLARGDLVYRRWKVLVEYDGWQHERDAKQRQWDHLRREQLEAAGWRVIVVTAADLATPHLVVARVRQALAARA